MPILRVTKNTRFIAEIELYPDQLYSIGRAPDCDLVLDNEPGISRQHLQVHFSEGRWIVEVLAKYSHLTHDGEDVTVLAITADTHFRVATFDFSFSGVIEPTVTNPESKQVPPHQPTMEMVPTSIVDETAAGINIGTPTLRILQNGRNEKIVTIEKPTFVVGRDKTCDVQILDASASRRHFRIINENGSFYIEDMGSANGTKINERLLKGSMRLNLKSGDVIGFMETQIYFEIRQASALVPITSEQYESIPSMNVVQLPDTGSGIKSLHNSTSKIKLWLNPPNPRERNMRWATLSIILFGLYMFATSDPTTTDVKDNQTKVNNKNAGQDQLIEDSYKLARDLYMQGRYELAVQELQKLHTLIPSYKESVRLLELSQHAIELNQKKQILDAQADQIEKLKARVEEVIQSCQNQMKPTTTSAELENCLTEARELDPENEKVKSLIAEVLLREENKKIIDAEKKEKQRKQIAARQLLEKERKIASVQADIARQIESLVSEANILFSANKYEEAVSKVDKALNLSPTNKKAVETKSKFANELERVMKRLYAESVLEEDIGNLEAAKEKWKKIRDMSIKDSQYYKRAIKRLRTYGDI